MKLEQEKLAVTSLDEQKTGLWDIAFIWFCANVAVPRLMIGGSLAELGFWKLMFIIIVGNILVFLPLLALGHIGYKVKLPTMAASRLTFGIRGSYLPSVANGIQLLGWAANVTVICGSSINAIVESLTGFSSLALWIVVTAVVQLLITAYGFRSITWLQRVSVPLLAILTLVVIVMIFKNYGASSIVHYTPAAAISLLVGLDIVASNAFAWGPMVCDYTRYAKSAGAASWGTLNVVNLYSASISFVNVFPKVEPWKIIVPAGAAVGLIALIPNLIGHFITFLTIVGAIFVPLIAIMLVDFFFIKKQKVKADDLLDDTSASPYWYQGGFNWKALVVWFVGIALYNVLTYGWTLLGACVPTFIVIAVLYGVIAKPSDGKKVQA